VSPEAPWAELVALAELERDLVRDGRWDEVPAASAQRLSAAQALGDPPAEARPHLERLLELQREIHAGLSTGRAFTLQKIGKIDRGSTALRGYRGGNPRPAATSVDGRA
jgi:HEAT repeat protein